MRLETGEELNFPHARPVPRSWGADGRKQWIDARVHAAGEVMKRKKNVFAKEFGHLHIYFEKILTALAVLGAVWCYSRKYLCCRSSASLPQLPWTRKFVTK